jgi:hypothetical protein
MSNKFCKDSRMVTWILFIRILGIPNGRALFDEHRKNYDICYMQTWWLGLRTGMPIEQIRLLIHHKLNWWTNIRQRMYVMTYKLKSSYWSKAVGRMQNQKRKIMWRQITWHSTWRWTLWKRITNRTNWYGRTWLKYCCWKEPKITLYKS